MSLISQLFRQLTSIDCPPDIERELIDYIKTFNGNVKIHRMFNIFNNTIADDEYVKCMNMKLPELKEYSRNGNNNRFRVSTFSTSGSTGRVVKVDYAYGCAYTKICSYAEDKAKVLMDDIMFNQTRFYDTQQDKVILYDEKQEIIGKCIHPLMQKEIDEINKAFDRYKIMWATNTEYREFSPVDDYLQTKVLQKAQKLADKWNIKKRPLYLILEQLKEKHRITIDSLLNRFKKLTLNRARKTDSMPHSFIPSFSHYHKSTARPICFFECNLLTELKPRRIRCNHNMDDVIKFNYRRRWEFDTRNQYL